MAIPIPSKEVRDEQQQLRHRWRERLPPRSPGTTPALPFCWSWSSASPSASALDWAATSGSSADALAGKQVQLKALDLETAPLRGLDKRVEDSRDQMQAF